jgi:hypothetical protein
MAAKKTTRRRTAAKASKKRTRKKVTRAQAIPEPSSGPEQRYLRDLLVRGEAVKPTRSGKLPQGATHAIVDDGEQLTVKRARFKLC